MSRTRWPARPALPALPALLAVLLAVLLPAAPAHAAPAHAAPAHAAVPVAMPGAPLALAPDDAARTFGVQTAAGDKPDRRPDYAYSSTPGASLTDQIAVRNQGPRPLTLQIYASDAFNTPDGGFDLLAAGTRPVDIGTWVRPAVGQLTIPGQRTVIVPFTVRVPTNATPGDHVGGIVASLRTIRTTQGGKKVAFEDRVGIRMYLRVAGQLRGALTVEGFSARYDGTPNPFGHGSVHVTYTIHNTGNLRLSGHQTIRVAGWFGMATLATGLPEVPELLPGARLRVDAVVRHVFPAVRLRVSAEVDPRPGAGDVDPRLLPASASAALVTFPWSLALVVALLALAAGVGVTVRRRPVRPRPDPVPRQTPVRSGS